MPSPLQQERPEAACLRLAEMQYGVIDRHQARALGLTSHQIHGRLRKGLWARLHPGVYRIRGIPSSWHQDVMAACRWGGQQAVASHRAAATLWGLYPGERRPPVEISTPGQARPPKDVLVHGRASLKAPEKTLRGPIPTTPVVRTLLDLGAVEKPVIVEEAVDYALRKRMVTLDRLKERLEEVACKGRPGISLMRRILNERGAESALLASRFERLMYRLLDGGGLPRPVPQYEIWSNGRFIARPDFAYPDRKVAIEADGYEYHSGRSAFQKDRTRISEMAACRWRAPPFTWEDLMLRGPYVVATIKRART